MKPIVLVPGMFGSILEDSEGTTIWPGNKMADLLNLRENFINNLSGTTNQDLDFVNWVPKTVESVPGVNGVDRLLKSSFLQTFSIKTLDYFVDIIVALKAIGYEEGVSLFAYSYDFRQSAANPRQMQRFEYFLQQVPKDPILIVHSMGGMIVRYFYHTNPRWADYFTHVISLNVCYDGGNGMGIMDTVNGYNMGISLLNDCTAGVYATSGLTATIYGSAYSQMPTQTLYFKRWKYRRSPSLLVKEDQKLWNSIKITDRLASYAYFCVLEKVVSEPCSVTYNISYWARRLAFLFRRNVTLAPTIPNAGSLPYTRACFRQYQLFKPVYKRAARVVENAEYDLIQCMMWWESEKFPFETHRQRNAPEIPQYQNTRNMLLNSAFAYVSNTDLPKMAKESFFMHAETAFPIECKNKMSLLDFYDQYYPEGTLERLVFGINYPLFLRHYEARSQAITWPPEFRFVSISSYGVPTPRDCYFDYPVDEVYELRFQKPRPIPGDGDGTVLLVSQLDDCVPQENVCERISFRAVGHKEILRHPAAIQRVLHWVTAFNSK